MNALVFIGVFGLFHPTHLQVMADRVYDLTLESRAFELPAGQCFTLSVPGKIERQFCGGLHVARSGMELLAVISVPLEVATAAAVAAELPADAPLEAAKAQAVLARSFYAAGGRHGDRFCDSTHCQFTRGSAPADSVAAHAAEATRGIVLTYRGKPFAPLYSASCGGRTFTAAEVGLREEWYPYFPVECPVCEREAKIWQRTVDAVPSRNELARVRSKDLPSNFFSAEPRNGGFVLHGRGEGHGIGFCQRGAMGLAREGISFREILERYLPNTALN